MSSSRQNCNVQDFKSFGVWCGNFFLCKLCAANHGSTEFWNVTELSEHIKDLYIPYINLQGSYGDRENNLHQNGGVCMFPDSRRKCERIYPDKIDSINVMFPGNRH